LADKTHI